MRRHTRRAFFAVLLLSTAGIAADDPAQYVDPLIGSWAPGFTNPGPQLPHGMVQLGPDTAEGPLNYGGYYIQNVGLTGFSHTHMSAGVFQGGQFPMMPVAGEVTLGSVTTDKPIPFYLSAFSHAGEVAEAGYYSVPLLRYGVVAELTATERAGFHRYAFPPGLDASVVLDASRDLKGYHDASVTVRPDGAVTARVRTTGPDHDVYLAARFDPPPTAIDSFTGSTRAPVAGGGATIEGSDVGLVVQWGAVDSPVLVRTALSYVSEDGALANLEAEISESRSFDDVRAAAAARWNDSLSRIDVETPIRADLVSFYTALYHAQLFPSLLSDADGRYPRLDSDVIDAIREGQAGQYTQFSLWDSYNGQNALLAVAYPKRYRDMIRSMANNVRNAEHLALGDRLPRWQLANRRPNYMSGAPVIPFLAEGWCRGLVDAEDETMLYDAMRAHVDAEWGANASLGWLPTPQPDGYPSLVAGDHRSAGTTLELGLADFALALVADRLGESADAAELVDRSLAYRNLLDPETGWIRPRDADGAWAEPFAPESDYGFQEGTSWQYSWLAMHDLGGLVSGMGGDAVVNERLDLFFGFPVVATTPAVWPKVQNQLTVFGIFYKGNQYAPGNEHDLEAPYVYLWAGAPWKTQATVRGVVSSFTPTPDGLPGNDDLGALSGWLAWSMLGVFPLQPGAPVYVLGSPVFPEATLRLPDGDLEIRADGASFAAKYLAGARLAGEPLANPFFAHGAIASGAVLDFATSALPDTGLWSEPGSRPPSIGADPIAEFGCRINPG